ncbi:hypothetical protein DPMN_105254 [Dreissena polymorpha]|uniref:Uncharacterized protein n=1 Tax=Dreissena polymorpha TaxID=45954 RepID=A0A9D4K0S0_DREPO|nr:hypothetical protein DPMN_105254 [Dreissena polymorpha]
MSGDRLVKSGYWILAPSKALHMLKEGTLLLPIWMEDHTCWQQIHSSSRVSLCAG